MADLKSTEEFSNQENNAAYDMATELFNDHKLDPTYGPGVYSGYALINGITDIEDLIVASDDEVVSDRFFGYYEDADELAGDLEDAQRNLDEVVIVDGYVFIR